MNPVNWTWRTLTLVALAIFGIAAYKSEGFYQYDEHFQIIEFAAHKLGITPASDLPWEFPAEIRPALQPLIAFTVIKTARAIGITSPFTQAFLLRLLIGWSAVLVFRRFARRLPPDGDDLSGKLLFATATLLWCMPFLGVRFSGENASALALLAGISLLPRSRAENSPAAHYALAGLLFGLAFYFRFQSGFALAGIGAWLIFQQRTPWRCVAALVAGGVAALALGILADYWFYGRLLLTPVRYFDSNILQAKAASFGVSPWWFYFPAIVTDLLPPLSLVLLILAAVGLRRNSRSVLVWTFVPFVVAHSVIAHKELRFLFPMMVPMLWLAVAGWLELRTRGGRFTIVAFRVCIAVNVLALAYVNTRPTRQYVAAWHYLYDYSQRGPAQLVAEGKDSPYWLENLRPRFYDAPNLTLHLVPDVKVVDSALVHTGDVILQRHFVATPIVPGHVVTRLFSTFPDWLLHFNVTNWQQRTQIWSVYRVE